MQVYIPSGISEHDALSRTTHLAVAAHHDDIEIMAYDGIINCFKQQDKHFTGVIVTDGGGSPRVGAYADYTDDDIKRVRKEEQIKAAHVGEYSAQVFLDYPNSAVKSSSDRAVINDLKQIISKTQPKYVYTHNLADKHQTHVGVAVKLILAFRELAYKPKAVYGCEVWRSLDWLKDGERVMFDVSGHVHLENALLGVFDSQICGGKRYNHAATGRRVANATFSESHSPDKTTALIYAMDLTPLTSDETIDIADFIIKHIDTFKNDVEDSIRKVNPV